MTHVLADNLAALTRHGLARPPSEPTPIITGTVDDLRLVTPDGRLVRLQSPRDPGREAQRQIDEAVGDRAVTLVAVLGAGDGTVLELLESRPGVRIVAVEPFPAGALAWLARRAWTDAIAAGRLILLVGPAYDGLPLMASRLAADVDHVPVIANPVLVREYPDALVAARQALDRLIGAMRANATARTRFEDTAFVNTLTNLPAILAGGDVAALTGELSGVPAIVLGAGPSLTRNLGALAARPWPGLVVCVDTALQPCLAAGVTPHVVVAVDPTALNARHLDGRRPAPDSYLVAEASVDPHAMELFPGRSFFFRVGDHAPWPWLGRHGLDLGRLDAWGSVVTAGVDLARRAGCSPIVLAGLDLAWTADAPYCRHTIYEDDWAREVVWGRSLSEIWQTALAHRQAAREPGLDGRPHRSTLDLVAFRDWLRAYVTAHQQVTFINATGAGILFGDRLAQTPLTEVLASLPPLDLDPLARLRERHARATGRPDAATVAAALRATPPRALLEGHSAIARWDADTLARAQAQASDALAVGWPSAPPPPPLHRRERVPQSPIPLPEQVEQARRWWPSTGVVQASAGTPDDRQRAVGWLAVALQHLGDLAAIDAPILDVAAEIELLPRIPALLLGTWTRASRRTAGAFADCLAAALAAADGLPTPGALTGVDDAVDAPRAMGRLNDASADAVFGLGWQWCWHAAAVSRSAPTEAGNDGLVVGPFLRLVGDAEPGDASDSDVVSVRYLLDAADTAVRRGTGTIVPPLSEAARQAPAGTPRIAAITREPLSPTSVARRHVVATLDRTHALLTRDDGSGSDVLDDAGLIAAPDPWPRAVSAELPFAGGRVAWDRRDGGHLLVRPEPGATADVIALPFQPYDMCVLEETVCFASDSGLWVWSPTAGPRHLGATVPLYVLHPHGRGVRAYGWPVPRRDGRRAVLTDAWDWTAGGTPRRRPIRAGHAIHDLAVQGPWRAEAWADRDLIRIAHDSGRWWWLTAPSPRKLAWAGSSLIATLMPQAEVVRVPDLLSHLAAQR